MNSINLQENLNSTSKDIIENFYSQNNSDNYSYYMHITRLIECSYNKNNKSKKISEHLELNKLYKLFIGNKHYFYMGLCYYSISNYVNAVKYFKKEINSKVKFINTYYYIVCKLKISNGSIKDYKQIIKSINAFSDEFKNCLLIKYLKYSINMCFCNKTIVNFEPFTNLGYINKEESNITKLNIVTDFEKETTNKIIYIDTYNQIIKIPNCNILSCYSDGKLLIHDNKNIYIGKKKYFSFSFSDFFNLKKEIIKIKGKVFCMNIIDQYNYYHILTEIIGRLCILEYNNLLLDLTLVLSINLPDYAKKILDKFKFKNIIYHKNTDKFICDELIFVDIGLDDLNFEDYWSLYLPNKYILDKINKKFITSNLNTESNYVVYISRKNENMRNMKNEELLINKVLLPLYGKSLIIFDRHYISRNDDAFLSQVKLFYNSNIIISPHGAGLSNIIFCKKGTKIVEFNMKPNCNRCYEYISIKRNLKYIGLDIITSFYYGDYNFKKGV